MSKTQAATLPKTTTANLGVYLVIEGAEGAGKTTIARMLVHELLRLGYRARMMHEPDGSADTTTQEIRRITQDPQYPMNTRTEVLLYNAARSQSLEAVQSARNNGEIVVVDRSYLSTIAVQFYGRGDLIDYYQLNTIIDFAVGDVRPDLTLVLDAPVDILQARVKQRGENERFDNLDSAMLERIRAGYLWEAKQRDMPVIHTTGSLLEVFSETWQHVASIPRLAGLPRQIIPDERYENDPRVAKVDDSAPTTNELAASNAPSVPESEPTALAHLLPHTPAAKVLRLKQSRAAKKPVQLPAYYVPSSLPDDIQCDYCDTLDGLLTKRQALIEQLEQYLLTTSESSRLKTSGNSRIQASVSSEASDETDYEVTAHRQAEAALSGLLPAACMQSQLVGLLQRGPQLSLDDAALQKLPRSLAVDTDIARARLVNVRPRNELDLVPTLLYSALDMSLAELQATVDKWPYDLKVKLLEDRLKIEDDDPSLILPLDEVVYTWDCLADIETLLNLQKAQPRTAILQLLTPRYGYSTPELVEAAELSDAYDTLLDTSLQLYSSLQAKGFTEEAQYTTLLGHKQRFLLRLNAVELASLPDSEFVRLLRNSAAEKHPILSSSLQSKLERMHNK